MSEPIFEASVRLQADVSDFEKQAQQSVKRVLDEIEQGTAQALRNTQQRLSRAASSATPVVVPTTVAPPVIPTIEPPPIEIPVTVVDGGGATSFLDAAVSKAAEAKQALVDLRIELAQVAKDLKAREAEQAQAISSGSLAQEAFERRQVMFAETGEDLPSLRQRSQELREQVALQERGTKQAEQQLATAQKLAEIDEQILASRQLAAEARTAEEQAASAGITGDTETQAARLFQAEVLGRQSRIAALNAEAQQTITLAGQVGGAAGATLAAEGNALLAESEKLRLEVERLQAAGAQAAAPGGPGGPPDERRGGFLDAFRSTAAGRTGGIGGLIGGAARFGIAGFAATAAFQTFSELTQAIRVTGDEAFTTEGKLRNLGAELLSGNLIGGIRAVLAQEPAKLTEGLQEAVDRVKELDDLTISSSQVLNLQRQQAQALVTEREKATGGSAFETFLKSQADTLHISQEQAAAATHEFRVETEGASDALKVYLEGQVDSGAINKETADQIARAAIELDRQAEAALNAATIWKQYAEAVTVGREAQDQFGLRGPGAISPVIQAGQGPVGQVVGQQLTGERRNIVTNPFENQVFEGQGGPEVAARIRESLNQRIQGERERLQADLQLARTAEQQARASFKAAKDAADGSGAAADEYEKVVAATTRTANAAGAVKDQAARAAEEITAANARIAAAGVSAIRDPEAQAQAQLRARPGHAGP